MPNIYVECLSVEIHSGSGEESTMSSFGEKKILHLMLTSHRGGGAYLVLIQVVAAGADPILFTRGGIEKTTEALVADQN